jgi:hypothetical protein
VQFVTVRLTPPVLAKAPPKAVLAPALALLRAKVQRVNLMVPALA